MKRLSRIVVVGSALFSLLPAGGCGNKPAVKKQDLVVEEKEAKKRDDALEAGLQAINHASEGAQYRDALALLNSYMSSPSVRQETQLSDAQREFLKNRVYLSADEIDEVEAGTFRPLDGQYLESCFLFREVARNLETAGLPPLELAEQALGWAMRQTTLDGPPGHTWIPSHLVVKRGFGTPSDRTLVYMALLQQMRLDCCALGAPHPLVGVVVPEKKDALYLFDVLLGKPVPGPEGKGIATLAEVEKNPKLLEPLGIAAADFAKVDFYLNSPLTGLAPRMFVLERLLQDQNPVVLWYDAAKVHQAISATTNKPIRIGNQEPPADPKTTPPRNSPTRSLRWFMPQADGGVTLGRMQEFAHSLQPKAQIAQQLDRWKLLARPDVIIYPEVGFTLLRQIDDIMLKFAVQPRDMMLRGQYNAALKRLDLIRTVLEDLEFSNLDEAGFQTELATFRTQSNTAYRALKNKDPLAAARLGELWSKDQYLLAVLQADPEIELSKYKKEILSYIVFGACKEVLGQKINLLMAQGLQEKAELLQANVDAQRVRGKPSQALENRTREAWGSTRSYWTKYVDRHALTATELKARFPQHNELWKRPETDLGNFHPLLREWTASCMARMYLARTLEQEGQRKHAAQIIDNLAQDLDALAKDEGLNKELDTSLAAATAGLKQLSTMVKIDPAPMIAQQTKVLAEFRPQSATFKALQQLVKDRRDIEKK